MNRRFLKRANRIENRHWVWRLHRFVRARLRNLCRCGLQWADEPTVGRAWRAGWDEEHYLGLWRWADAGFHPQVIYDVGANDGRWAEMAQTILQPDRCILFEPLSRHHDKILSRRPAAPVQWQVIPVALGEKEESLCLKVAALDAASSLLPTSLDAPSQMWGGQIVGEETVKVMPLDRLVKEQNLPTPDLVKIDVQGFEAQLLVGGAETLRAAKRIIIEVSLRPIFQGQELLPQILARLDALGFTLTDVTETVRRWPEGELWQVDLWLEKKIT